MHNLEFLSTLIGQYGLYAVFLLVMIEGDITLLLAGVLAHSQFFGDYSFLRVLLWGTLGGAASDNIAYLLGRGFCKGIGDVRFYRAAQPRLERLTNKFGGLSIFLSKYIYGLRWASCIFYGVGRMPYLRFLFAFAGQLFCLGLCAQRGRLLFQRRSYWNHRGLPQIGQNTSRNRGGRHRWASILPSVSGSRRKLKR